MNDLHPRHGRPDFAQPGGTAKATMAFAAFLISAALLGGLLGLFEMQGRAAAMARAATPADAASGAVAVREPQAGPRARSARRLATRQPA